MKLKKFRLLCAKKAVCNPHSGALRKLCCFCNLVLQNVNSPTAWQIAASYWRRHSEKGKWSSSWSWRDYYFFQGCVRKFSFHFLAHWAEQHNFVQYLQWPQKSPLKFHCKIELFGRNWNIDQCAPRLFLCKRKHLLKGHMKGMIRQQLITEHKIIPSLSCVAVATKRIIQVLVWPSSQYTSYSWTIIMTQEKESGCSIADWHKLNRDLCNFQFSVTTSSILLCVCFLTFFLNKAGAESVSDTVRRSRFCPENHGRKPNATASPKRHKSLGD